MMKYITNDGKLLQGSTYREILEAYQATSKFDADTPFEDYLDVMWRRLQEWYGPRRVMKNKPKDTYELAAEIYAGLLLNGFLTEVV